MKDSEQSPDIDREDLRSVGVVVGAHGLQGALSIASLSDFPERFAALQTVYLVREDVVLLKGTVKRVRWAAEHVHLQLREITARNAAEAFKGADVCIIEAEVWPLPTDTYFVGDLLGFRGVDESGTTLGTLIAVSKGAQDILEFDLPGKETMLVPFVAQWVGRVDVSARTIEIRNWRLLADPETIEPSPQDDH